MKVKLKQPKISFGIKTPSNTSSTKIRTELNDSLMESKDISQAQAEAEGLTRKANTEYSVNNKEMGVESETKANQNLTQAEAENQTKTVNTEYSVNNKELGVENRTKGNNNSTQTKAQAEDEIQTNTANTEHGVNSKESGVKSKKKPTLEKVRKLIQAKAKAKSKAEAEAVVKTLTDEIFKNIVELGVGKSENKANPSQAEAEAKVDKPKIIKPGNPALAEYCQAKAKNKNNYPSILSASNTTLLNNEASIKENNDNPTHKMLQLKPPKPESNPKIKKKKKPNPKPESSNQIRIDRMFRKTTAKQENEITRDNAQVEITEFERLPLSNQLYDRDKLRQSSVNTNPSKAAVNPLSGRLPTVVEHSHTESSKNFQLQA